MKNATMNFKFSLYFLIIVFSGLNCTNYPVLNQPDINAFNNQANGSLLVDSLKAGKLSVGMPHSIVSQIFKNWPDNLESTKILVASLGSKQPVKDEEGWGRVYNDPFLQVYMDEYNTIKGKLNIWYQLPSFYRMDVSSGDTLVIILPDTTLKSVIFDLKNSNVLSTVNSFDSLLHHKLTYAEIHYHDNQWRTISYWYSMMVLSHGNSFMLKDLQYEIYPIELMELNGARINSFEWR